MLGVCPSLSLSPRDLRFHFDIFGGWDGWREGGGGGLEF